MIRAIVLIFCVTAVAALPYDPVIRKDPGPRYQYVEAGDGSLHLVDLWEKASDSITRYNPDAHNIYHLFTRLNPSVSQPLILGSSGLLGSTNFSPNRRTIVIIHGWLDSVTGDVNTVLVPAFLSAEDVNVIVVDWNAGAGNLNYFTAVANTVTSGQAVARFLYWLTSSAGIPLSTLHLVGHSLGGHQVGIVGRNLGGDVSYITALDPAFPGWITHDDKFRSTDGRYTEVIHTNSGLLGYMATLGDADFYPNGGINMPGCNSQDCDHSRCYFYLAESLTSGGFTGRRCASYVTAMTGNCVLWGTLHMGGLTPKTGSSGIYYLETNASPPFSRG